MGIECRQPEIPRERGKIRVDVLDLRVRRRTFARKCDLLTESSHPTREEDGIGTNNGCGRVYCVLRLGDQHARTRSFPPEGLHEVFVRRTTADDCCEEGEAAASSTQRLLDEVEDVCVNMCCLRCVLVLQAVMLDGAKMAGPVSIVSHFLVLSSTCLRTSATLRVKYNSFETYCSSIFLLLLFTTFGISILLLQTHYAFSEQ